jgi:hypothetical protein
MKSLTRILSVLAVLTLGSFAFAGEKKAEGCKACTADVPACCNKEKAEKTSCCQGAKKDTQKKPENK